MPDAWRLFRLGFLLARPGAGEVTPADCAGPVDRHLHRTEDQALHAAGEQHLPPRRPLGRRLRRLFVIDDAPELAEDQAADCTCCQPERESYRLVQEFHTRVNIYPV